MASDILDGTASITANLDQLNDPHIDEIVISDNGQVGVSVQQLMSDVTAIGKLQNANASPVLLAINDTAADVQAGLSTLVADAGRSRQSPCPAGRSSSRRPRSRPISRRSTRSRRLRDLRAPRRTSWRTSISSTTRTSLRSRFRTTGRSALPLRSSRLMRRRSATCAMRTGCACGSQSMIRPGMFKPACRRWFKYGRDQLHQYVLWADRRFGGRVPRPTSRRSTRSSGGSTFRIRQPIWWRISLALNDDFNVDAITADIGNATLSGGAGVNAPSFSELGLATSLTVSEALAYAGAFSEGSDL